MPIHDWSRVIAGTFHHFHHAWIFAIGRALNAGVLPPDYYALTERVAGGLHPDVLALDTERPDSEDTDPYARKRNRVAIRHTSDDRVVAIFEIDLPGNKASWLILRSFIEKEVAVGDELPDMPLFLKPDLYVLVPLEATYRAAFDAVPRRFREVLNPPGGAGAP